MDQPIVQSLWIGSRLSVMEQLSIRSFLDQGHAFHLYAYQPLQNVPAGTIVRPGNEILPESEIFCYQTRLGKGSFAGFADSFRYKLLLERGGWWSDLDCVCIRPLDFAEEHVLGYERRPKGAPHVNVAIIKAPVGSRLIEHCWRVCQMVDRSRLMWAEIGPQLMGEAVAAVDVPVRILDPGAFYPIDFWQTWQLIQERKVPENSYSIHLWHSQWKRSGLDPDARYDADCIYEQLKRKHGVSSPSGAARGPSWSSVARRRLKLLEVGFRQWKRRSKRMPSKPTGPEPESIPDRDGRQRLAG